jgi:hypothetical protein
MIAKSSGQEEIVAWTSLSTGSDAAGPICSSSLENGNDLVSHQPEKASVPLTVTSG